MWSARYNVPAAFMLAVQDNDQRPRFPKQGVIYNIFHLGAIYS